MGLFASEGGSGEFELPSEGVQQGVCCDVIDLGVIPGWEGRPQHKVQIVFQVPETGKDGKRLTVQQRCTLSMNEKSTLRKMLEAWRGKKFEAGEASRFDIMSLVGKNAQLGIVHAKDKMGRTWANIGSIMPLLKGMPNIEVDGYVRREPKKRDDTPDFMKPKPGDAF